MLSTAKRFLIQPRGSACPQAAPGNCWLAADWVPFEAAHPPTHAATEGKPAFLSRQGTRGLLSWTFCGPEGYSREEGRNGREATGPDHQGCLLGRWDLSTGRPTPRERGTGGPWLSVPGHEGSPITQALSAGGLEKARSVDH